MPDPDTQVTLKEITADILRSILELKVSPEQEGLVAPNAVSIAQAYFEEHAWFRAIYAGDTPVGFVMLYLDEDKPEYWVWRFMVDARYQGNGYGLQAMRQVIEHVRNLPNARDLLLSYVPADGSAAPFYARCGFADTGEWEGDEKVMRLAL